MKIGIESQRIFRRRKHGMDVVAVELIRQIQDLDKLNQFVLFARDGEDRNCIHETENFKVRTVKALTYGDWEQYSLPKAVKAIKPDLLHCTANTGPVKCEVPLILTLHDIIFLRETSFKGSAYQNFGNIYRRLVVPVIMKNARLIVTVSEEEKKIISSTCDIDPERIRVVYNGVHERFGRKYSDSEKHHFRNEFGLPEQFILHLGNTAPKKNTNRMIRAYVSYAESVADPMPLVIADYQEHLLMKILQDIKHTGMRRNIFPIGYVSSATMPLLYSCAEVFVYPSILESFGLPVLEAMAAGKIVITSDIPALREVGGDAAVYINPEDTNAISAAIKDAVTNSAAAGENAIRGSRRASMFSWKNSANKLLEIYSEALK